MGKKPWHLQGMKMCFCYFKSNCSTFLEQKILIWFPLKYVKFIVVHKKLKIPRIKLWCCRCKSFVDKSCKHWGTIDSKHETKEITVWSWIKRLNILLNRSHLDYGFQQLTCEENIVWNFELITENVNILLTSFFDHDISLAPYCFSTIHTMFVFT